MRHRRWVLLLAAVLIAVVPLALLGLRAASRHPAFRQRVAERLVPAAAGRVTIGSIDFGLASVRAGDVRVELADGGFVEVPQATVGLSLRRFLTSGFRPARSLGTAVVTGPRVVIVVGGPGEEAQGGRPPFDPASIFDKVPDRVSISDASVTVVDRGGAWSFGVRSLDVVARRRGLGRFEADVSGGCLGSDDNVTGTLSWDDASGTLAAGARMTGGTLSGGDPPPLPGAPVRPLSGRASASVEATLRRGAPAVWTVAFEIFDSDLAVPALGETIRSAHAAGSFDGDRLEVIDASGRWRSGALRA